MYKILYHCTYLTVKSILIGGQAYLPILCPLIGYFLLNRFIPTYEFLSYLSILYLLKLIAHLIVAKA